MVMFARVKGWVNLIKKLKLASVCFPEKKKKYCKALCFPLSTVLRFQFLVCKLPGSTSMTSDFLFIAFCIMK